MNLPELPLPDFFKQYYSKFPQLTPIQNKAISSGLLEKRSLLVCAPTASGKTLIATMAIINTLNNTNALNNTYNNTPSKGKSLYLVPLKALANEKYKEYQNLFKNTPYKVAMATGDVDDDAPYLAKYDLLILTTEKLDALLRHQVSWIREVKTVIVDEIHLLNDPARGPTLEIVLTLLKSIIKPQLIGLSATIGNPEALAA